MKRTFRRATIAGLIILLLLSAAALLAVHHSQQRARNQALIAAIKRNRLEEAVRLLRQGADANTRYVPMTTDQLIAAVEQDTWPLPPNGVKPHVSFWQWVMQAFRPQPPAKANSISVLVVALDENLDCPSDISVPAKSSKLIKALIKAGANINVRGRYGVPALQLAIEYERHDIVELMLEKGAKIQARDDNGNTSLMSSAEIGDAILTKYLLEHGITINAANKHGNTALMLAFRGRKRPDYATIKVLLENGADVSMKDQDGDTALTLAKADGDRKIIDLLQQAEKQRK